MTYIHILVFFISTFARTPIFESFLTLWTNQSAHRLSVSLRVGILTFVAPAKLRLLVLMFNWGVFALRLSLIRSRIQILLKPSVTELYTTNYNWKFLKNQKTLVKRDFLVKIFQKLPKNAFFSRFFKIFPAAHKILTKQSLLVIWESSENHFGRPRKKGSTKFSKFFWKSFPSRENPRSAPADAINKVLLYCQEQPPKPSGQEETSASCWSKKNRCQMSNSEGFWTKEISTSRDPSISPPPPQAPISLCSKSGILFPIYLPLILPYYKRGEARSNMVNRWVSVLDDDEISSFCTILVQE